MINFSAVSWTRKFIGFALALRPPRLLVLLIKAPFVRTDARRGEKLPLCLFSFFQSQHSGCEARNSEHFHYIMAPTIITHAIYRSVWLLKGSADAAPSSCDNPIHTSDISTPDKNTTLYHRWKWLFGDGKKKLVMISAFVVKLHRENT
jgi:hypothetical protein